MGLYEIDGVVEVVFERQNCIIFVQYFFISTTNSNKTYYISKP